MHSNAKFCVKFKAIGLICANSREKPLQIILGVRSGSYFDIFTNENWFHEIFYKWKISWNRFSPDLFWNRGSLCTTQKPDPIHHLWGGPPSDLGCIVSWILRKLFLTCFSSAMTQRISFFSFLISKIITYYFGKIENALSL